MSVPTAGGDRPDWEEAVVPGPSPALVSARRHREPEKWGDHFKLDDCRIWMRLHFWVR